MDEGRPCESETRREPAADEAALLERLARNDPKVLDEIVSRYRGRVARLAYRLLGWDSEAEDIVQDVFLAVLRHRRRFRGDSSLWTWLAAITVNRCRSLHRKRWLRLKFLRSLWQRPSQPVASDADPALLEQVRRAVRTLPARLREAAVLRYLEEMPIDEIAKVLKLSRGAVDVRLHRARARLAEMLKDLFEEEG